MKRIDVVALKRRLDDGDELYLVDVREPYEWEIASIPGTTHRFPLKYVMDHVNEIQDKECIVYCHSGKRSLLAIEMIQEVAPIQCTNLEGGVLAWAQHIDPSMTTY